MAIKVEGTALDFKLGSDSVRRNASDLIWDDIEDGKYNAELYIIYPWKTLTQNTKVRIKDEDGKYIKNEDGTFAKEEISDVSWAITDVVLKIDGGMYDGYAVKGTLSTHPDMIGSTKRFLYNASLFDVELKDIFKHTGTKVGVHVKHRTDTFKDKLTGLDKTVNNAYVSYYEKYDEELNNELTRD
jgi:hypothetical protein